MPSTRENKFLKEKVVVHLSAIDYTIDVYDTPLSKRWVEALRQNLLDKRILEKNFCFLGFAGHKRNLKFLVNELNNNIEQINSYHFNPPYKYISRFREEDFQYSASLPMGGWEKDDVKNFPGLMLKHESCNLLHLYFEELQGTAWQLSPYYKQADHETKYAIRQLNNLCHEIETWVNAYRNSVGNPDWIRSAQITTFLNSPRYELHDEDFQLFKANRYDRELGGVYLHWSQIGKTLREVHRDEGAPTLTDAMCSEINHQKYYSGEFDVEWGNTITTDKYEWYNNEIQDFRNWVIENGYDWEDPKLALGYAKLGQVNMDDTFGNQASYRKVYKTMLDNLDIRAIEIRDDVCTLCDYPYTLESEDWKQMQINALRRGYESHSMR